MPNEKAHETEARGLGLRKLRRCGSVKIATVIASRIASARHSHEAARLSERRQGNNNSGMRGDKALKVDSFHRTSKISSGTVTVLMMHGYSNTVKRLRLGCESPLLNRTVVAAGATGKSVTHQRFGSRIDEEESINVNFTIDPN